MSMFQILLCRCEASDSSWQVRLHSGTWRHTACLVLQNICVRPILDAQAVRRVGIVMMSFHWTVLTDKDLKSLDSERSEFLQ